MPALDTTKVIIFAVIAAIIAFLIYDRQVLKTDIADQKTTIVQLQDANANFVAAADRANKAIADEKKLREQQQQQYKIAMKEAAAREEKSKAQQLAILNQKVEGDHCLFAHQLFTGYMKGRHP